MEQTGKTMSFISDIRSRHPIDFADAMVDKITRQFPPTSEPQLVKKGARRRLEAILEHILKDLDDFQRDNRLGWIGKARLGNAFRWKLTDRGYSKQFSEALTEGIINRIAVQ
jgi:hypothetical protein